MKIIVVGGGTSGILSALALGKEGHEVLVLEKNDKIGGLCRSETIDGYTVDIGVHAITMLNNGPLTRLLDKYSQYLPNFKPYGEYYIRTDQLHKIPVSMHEWMTTAVIPHKDKLLVTSKIIDLMTVGFDKEASVCDIVKDLNLSEPTLEFFDTFSYFLSGEGMDKTPLWRLFTGAGYIPEDDIIPFIYNDLRINPLRKSISKKFDSGRLWNMVDDGLLKSIKNKSKKYITKFMGEARFGSQGYPMGGVQSICNCVCNSMINTTLKTNEEVLKITQEENTYYVYTKNDIYKADVIIYSAPAVTIPNVVKNVEEVNSYNEKFKNIKFSESTTIWVGDEENYFPYIGSEVWVDYPCWATTTSNYDPWLAPKGKHLMGFSFVNSKEEDAIISIENKLNINLDKVDMLHIQKTIPEHASCAIDQFFVYPKIKNNFYVVGTDSDPRSMGVTRASYSVEMMLSEFKNTYQNNLPPKL
ncbi:phytoene dehydrogenase-like protein [Methanococcus voltae]|uniref:Phytoene dehydrogenase-like protein n=1 Tax=Methanococcus voltae TaxID=2188 RepID=A0A8J7RIZ1_METVO|nr:FAD-dependent oxidoreductase [Methanococcus voltae]MBP2201761.1 phytoene dehydrogenase-like protein [Methanococcus voltae]